SDNASRPPTAPRRGAGRRASAGGRPATRGGTDRGEPFAPLAEPILETCAACYLIGATADRLAAELAQVVEAGVPLHRCADLDEAVRAAAAAARAGEVVVLSPACARFRYFDDF